LFRSLDKILPIPQHYHASFARWHELAMLKTPEHLRELERLEQASLAPEQIGHFIEVIRHDWGFNIYRVVAEAKARLSAAPGVDFRLRLGALDIEQEIAREDFEHWIKDDIARIAETVDRLLATEGVSVDAIDSVFLTGGSSFIPAVRRVFADRFGAQRLADGENFQSVAYGLALLGLDDDLGPWLARTAPAT
ncbi:MAG TPA: Hsp70 family protein, partial [Stellaceae bacterium]|nr:Hsp70 family protein [Stellaceae bacterium]